MSSVEELAQRVAALEHRMGMETGLRAMTDRDLSELASTIRATGHLVQALSITQSQHTEVLAEQTRLLGEQGAALARVETGMGQILGLLNQLIERDADGGGDER